MQRLRNSTPLSLSSSIAQSSTPTSIAMWWLIHHAQKQNVLPDGTAFRNFCRWTVHAGSSGYIHSSARSFNTSSTLWTLPKTAGETTESKSGAFPAVITDGAAVPKSAKPDLSVAKGKVEAEKTATLQATREGNQKPDDTSEAKDEKKRLAAEGKEKATVEVAKGLKREAAVETAEAVSVGFKDVSTPEARRKKERLLDAEKSLLIEELFAQDDYQRFIHTTEVSTTEGLRWLDVSASLQFFEHPLLADVPEGQFVYAAMRKLFGCRFPIGFYASVASGAALPATYVDDNWACLVLRSTKEFMVHQDGNADRLSGTGGSSSSGRYSERPPWDLPSLRQRWQNRNLNDNNVNHAALSNNRSVGHCVYNEATDDYYPRRSKVSQQSARYFEQLLYCPRLEKRGAAVDILKPGWFSKSSSAATEVAAALRRHRAASPSTYHSPLTMSDFTDRLTVFIGKELHPVEKDPDMMKMAAETTEANEALTLSLDVDHARTEKRQEDLIQGSNISGTFTEALPWTAKDNNSKSNPPSSPINAKEDGAAAQPIHYEVRWRVITVHRSPITFIRDMQSQWNKLSSRGGRPVRTMRSVPARRLGPLDGEEAVKLVLRRAARSASMVEEEEDEEISNDGNGHDDMHNVMVDRVTGWEDLVRLLFHGAARTLQESAYGNTRRLEVMETEIFDASDNSAQHLRSMTRLMAALHLLSREATIHNAILRESKVAYQKLKRVLDHPMDLADQRELLYVDSVLSISAHLEEQSESLLSLQFSVAMNQTEQHLRTLTIFNTLFIPLDFICTCFGSDIFSSPALSHSKAAMYGVFGLMATTAVVTLRWIRRNLR